MKEVGIEEERGVGREIYFTSKRSETRPCRERKGRYGLFSSRFRLCLLCSLTLLLLFFSPFSRVVRNSLSPREPVRRISRYVRYPAIKGAAQPACFSFPLSFSLFARRLLFSRDKLLPRPSTLSRRRASDWRIPVPIRAARIVACTIELILVGNISRAHAYVYAAIQREITAHRLSLRCGKFVGEKFADRLNFHYGRYHFGFVECERGRIVHSDIEFIVFIFETITSPITIRHDLLRSSPPPRIIFSRTYFARGELRARDAAREEGSKLAK